MLSLCVDLYIIISASLNDNEKVKLSISTKKLTKLTHIFTYFDKTCFNKIKNLPYFNNFTNVILDSCHIDILLPLKCERIHTIMFKRVQNIKTTSGEEAKITHLTVNGNCYPTAIPTSITHLTINSTYWWHTSYPLDSFVSVTHLEFGDFFNSYIDVRLNKSIQYLKLGNIFDTHVDFKKLSNLKQLIFGDDFNQNVDGKIPESVTHLTFGTKFDQGIFLAQCKNMTHLTFGENFNQPDRCIYLPTSLTHLTFGKCFNMSVSKAIIYYSFGGRIPVFGLQSKSGDTIDQTCLTNACVIPQMVTHLTFGDDFNHPLNTIPQSVRYLTVGCNFEYFDTVPSSVTHLTIKK